METSQIGLYVLYTIVALYVLRKIVIRLRLSRAKHPSLTGHSKMMRRISKWIPSYEFDEDHFFNCDNAPDIIARQRENGFKNLVLYFKIKYPNSLEISKQLDNKISDIAFINKYRVPFQFSRYVNANINHGNFVTASFGTQVRDIDENLSYDLTGSYGVNVFGYDFYKECMTKGMARVTELGPVLGSYHPVIVDNVNRLRKISGLDEISFHMSGTEAVMQAVRLARYNTGKSHLVRFCGAYHGWWDGVQPGIGNQRVTNDVYTLKDMDKDTLQVLKTRKDIACVLVNPLQAMHPNDNAPSDSMLIASGRSAHFDREAYTVWLKKLQKVCNDRGIVLILDEVFVGFRLAYGGAQEYFKIKADMVTYGKTLGGGFPVGVVCGKHQLMKRFKEKKPLNISFARGTFNSHPYVMAAMNEFLKGIEQPYIRATYDNIDIFWNNRVNELNLRLASKNLPVKIINLASIWTVIYSVPCRYNWMLQFYLRAQGLAISWIGTGRIIMSHNFSDEDYEAVMQRFVTAVELMQNDGWWWQNETLTNRAIKKQIFYEMLTSFFKVNLPWIPHSNLMK
ncbi:MAG: aminotransferase class III-fold pyridoxal phosphate-dependent enzyme [Thiohalomonadales bacterium]